MAEELRDQLSEDDAARLDALVAAAHRHQREAMAQAMDDGLSFVPRMLRGAVKKVLFG